MTKFFFLVSQNNKKKLSKEKEKMKRLSSLFLLATALAAAAATTNMVRAATEPLAEPAAAPVSKDVAAIVDALTKGGISPETFAESLTPEQQAIYLSKLQPSVAASAESGAESGEPASRRVSGRWQPARLLSPDPASLAALADAPAAGSGYGELALKRALSDEESPYGRFEMSAKYWPGGVPPLRDLPPPSAYADVQYALDRPEVAARGVGPASVDAGGEDRRQTPIAESDVGGADGTSFFFLCWRGSSLVPSVAYAGKEKRAKRGGVRRAARSEFFLGMNGDPERFRLSPQWKKKRTGRARASRPFLDIFSHWERRTDCYRHAARKRGLERRP